ncbi:hypothetical protein FACS1894206_01050 [Deltaproteobacteria bacterium]|nr:hypothetical protein FACS1894206_01050 [Deltaproteobacteria bacterium]
MGSDASPARMVAVDKKQQTLFLFERHSPMRVSGQFACTTGQNEGDKFVQGDHKTPEGIYFVTGRLSSGLDYAKYGHEAYTLNYPNPVDRVRRKTGYGIWIHGRGVPISPNLTEGCVSLNNTDIAMLGKNLLPGTPVTLAAQVNFSPIPTREDNAVINALYKKTHDWAKAWSSRSARFFDYYEPESYTLAQGESFTAFREQKERVFKAVKGIDVKVNNVHVLQGPGYWVTWFEQDYRATNLSAKGVRRLYWQADKSGTMRIVGMEWEPLLSGTLTAGLSGASIAATDSDLAASSGKAAATKPAAADDKIPALAPDKAMETTQSDSAPVMVALAEAQAIKAAEVKPVESPKAVSSANKIKEIPAFIETWRKAWEKGDIEAYIACYTKDAAQGNRKGASVIRAQKRAIWGKNGPKSVELTNIRITPKQEMVVVDMHQSYTDSKSFADMGVKTLYLQMDDNTWHIAREDWSSMP